MLFLHFGSKLVVYLLQGSVVGRRLPILNIQHGAKPTDSIGMPVAAWILGECLLRWASLWKAPEVSLLDLTRQHVLSSDSDGLSSAGSEMVQGVELSWLRAAQVDAAAGRVRDSVLSTAEAEGLTYQSYWLSATLALGAFLKVNQQLSLLLLFQCYHIEADLSFCNQSLTCCIRNFHIADRKRLVWITQ